MIALGIDPGTAACGFGVVASDGASLRFIDAGTVRTDPAHSDADRLAELAGALDRIIDQHRPDRVAVERLFFQRNVRTAMTVGQARGVALLVAARHGLPVGEPTPNEVKLAVCGNGSADKKQVATMVGRLLGIQLNGAGDDATDALAVAIGALRKGASA